MPNSMAMILHERRKGVSQIEYVNPCPADWVPIPNRCHQNAAAWVERFSSWEVVRGWLLIAEHDVLGTTFDAHSVVRDAGGVLWDVTQKVEHRFLVHPGENDEFVKQVEAGPWVRLSYTPGLLSQDITGADMGNVLYVYKCADCGKRGDQHRDDDTHEGEASVCDSCGSPVTLECDGGVSLETSQNIDADASSRARGRK
jgi:DNA-directed RNA polymerase subunit RPC12/RpoP